MNEKYKVNANRFYSGSIIATYVHSRFLFRRGHRRSLTIFFQWAKTNYPLYNSFSFSQAQERTFILLFYIKTYLTPPLEELLNIGGRDSILQESLHTFSQVYFPLFYYFSCYPK